MNQKQYQLMNLFTSSEKKKYTYSELTDLLQLGKRSVTNYINELNDFLSENGFKQIQLLPDNTFQLDVPLQELPKIRKKYFSRPLYEYHFSQEERVTIIKLLLCKQNTVSTSDIMRSLDISKKTCLSDMKLVAQDLKQQDIPFIAAATGYSIDVNEIFRRDYLINSFHTFLNVLGDNSSFSEISGIDLWISRYFHLELLKDQIFPILLNWQRENEINIEGYQFYQLLWILVVAADRIRQGHPIIGYPCASDYATIQISENLYSHLEKALSLPFTTDEVYFLASYIDGLSLTSLPQMPLGTIPSNTVIHTFLVNVSRDLKLKLANDNKLYLQLSAHIKSFFSLLERNTTFDRNFYKELEEEYPAICKSVKNNLYILEHSFHRTYNENETAFLVMHIAAAVSKILTDRQDFKVLVVCDSGPATASYVTNKLKYYCKIDDIDTVSSFELNDYLRTITPAPNLIISFYPIEGTTIPMVIVSPGLPSRDLSQIQEKMYASKKDENNLLNKRSSHSSSLISSSCPSGIFTPDRIALDFSADTWQEALQLGGNLLMEEGSVTQSYIDSIIRNVEINGPYFVFWPGVALAHANVNSKSIPFQASLIRLKHPVAFHNDLNDPVKYIFTFIASDTPGNDDKIVSIINLASSPTLFQHLDQAKTPEEAFEIIRKTERGL
ncbi:BglG family transcription antiterminator [Anaerostipes sp.]|uniref:BglG family transcription antiterminator n=1 Tax=Anaerostipes sp. TaxID=1872530 RepID=UPI00257982B3|nr:PTS sugar transporter subunit IIA [Anaerostipes sp.]